MSTSEDGDPRVHDLMNRMDDLGFAQAVVDGLAEVLRSPAGLEPSAPLAQIFLQLLQDLACFAHGRVAERPGATKKEVAEAIFAVLREEGWSHGSLLREGPQCLDQEEARILALDFLLAEVQAAKMIALAEYKEQMARNAAAMEATTINDAPPSAAAAAAGKGPAPVKGQQGQGKKRVGPADEVPTDVKRVKAEADSVPMEGVEAVEEASVAMEEDAASSADAELSYELQLLAHTLQVVLAAPSAAASASASSPAQVNGVTALRLLRSRIDAWLGESPAHAQAIALPPLFQTSEFTPLQSRVLADVYRTFADDYSLRVRVMRKRLEVTLQSFMRGGKGKACAESLSRLAAAKLATFPLASQVDEYELWCATAHVVHIARLTSREYAMRSSIKRVIIGKVPDRGGRVDTNTRIEAEYGMPAFTQRAAAPEASGGRRGGHGGGHHVGHGHGGRGGSRGRGR